MDDKQREKEDRLIRQAMKVLESRMTYGPVTQSPATVREYLTLRFAGLKREVFSVLFLDTRHRVIACEDLFHGTLASATVHPREVIRRALELNAAAVILAHNHPSGVPELGVDLGALTVRLTGRIKGASADPYADGALVESQCRGRVFCNTEYDFRKGS